MKTLKKEESERAFKDYISDAQKRYEHDQQFPNEPRQVRPGEDVRMVDGKVSVSGQIAGMSINEKLFQTLMRNNPHLSFGMEESYPLKAVYGNAAPLGPIMDLGSQNEG